MATTRSHDDASTDEPAPGVDGGGRGSGTTDTLPLDRFNAFSDGVFAIVVTLLVLEIKVPHVEAHDSLGELARVLWSLMPKFVSWVISFVTVCVIWLNHHRLFKLVARIDNGLFWWNANLLLWTSFIPFPTALMGDYPGSPLAVSLYGLVMGLMALGFVLMRRRLLLTPGLLAPEVDLATFRRATRSGTALREGMWATVTLPWYPCSIVFLHT